MKHARLCMYDVANSGGYTCLLCPAGVPGSAVPLMKRKFEDGRMKPKRKSVMLSACPTCYDRIEMVNVAQYSCS